MAAPGLGTGTSTGSRTAQFECGWKRGTGAAKRSKKQRQNLQRREKALLGTFVLTGSYMEVDFAVGEILRVQ
jgi:hypothetical protein